MVAVSQVVNALSCPDCGELFSEPPKNPQMECYACEGTFPQFEMVCGSCPSCGSKRVHATSELCCDVCGKVLESTEAHMCVQCGKLHYEQADAEICCPPEDQV